MKTTYTTLAESAGKWTDEVEDLDVPASVRTALVTCAVQLEGIYGPFDNTDDDAPLGADRRRDACLLALANMGALLLGAVEQGVQLDRDHEVH